MSCSKIQSLRPCAFCIVDIPAGKELICSKCHRRAYCSKECQVADWVQRKDGKPSAVEMATGIGQGHKHWCQLTVGEEGIDWKVDRVEGKGRGLIALRALPAFFRIIVEGGEPFKQTLFEHPGFVQLVPKDGSPLEKFTNNCVGTSNGSAIGFRISMGNHACDANSAFIDDESYNVVILYSLCPIEEGEEICYQYNRFNDTRQPLKDLSLRAAELNSTYGIVCPPDCICKNKKIRNRMEEIKQLDRSVMTLCAKGRYDQAMIQMREMIQIGKDIKLPENVMSSIHFLAFELCCVRKKTVKEGMSRIEEVIKFSEAVCHPQSETEVLRFKRQRDNPSLVPGYGMGD